MAGGPCAAREHPPSRAPVDRGRARESFKRAWRMTSRASPRHFTSWGSSFELRQQQQHINGFLVSTIFSRPEAAT